MRAKWIPAFAGMTRCCAGMTWCCAGMTRYAGRRTGNFEGSDICRAMAAHGALSGIKDEAKLPPPLFCQEPQLPTATFFCELFSDKMSGCPVSNLGLTEVTPHPARDGW